MRISIIVFVTLIVSVLSQSAIFAQVSFAEATADVLPVDVKGGVASAIADVDGDTFDDLIIFDTGRQLKIFLYRGKSDPYEEVSTIPQVNFGGVWSVVAGDMTGDGLTDIIAASPGNVVLYRQLAGLEFTQEVIYEMDWLPQSANLVDIDIDGDMDYFLCNDDGVNIILENINGTFVESDLIEFTTLPPSDNSGNYSSVWTDIDGDNDLELYIAKCRAGVTDPNDPRRVNALYLNIGNTDFLERADNFNLDERLQSWSVDAADVNNDGDIDFFITNHDGPHKLLVKGIEKYISFNYQPDLIENFAFQGVFHDMDNNGWLDIIITDGNENMILFNDNMEFNKQVLLPTISDPVMAIVGDVNRDGFADIWGQYANGFTGSAGNSSPDLVWLNEANDNNWVTIRLTDAMPGTKVYLNTSAGTQYREIKYGRSYGQQPSTQCHFGLGELENIESIRVQWLDGRELNKEWQYGINSFFLISSDDCITELEQPQASSTILCEGGSLEISSKYGNDVTWSNGESGSTTAVQTTGLYQYSYTNALGCEVVSDYVKVTGESDKYVSFFDDSLYLHCFGESVTLEVENGVSFLWSDGNTDQVRDIAVENEETYTVSVTSECGTQYESRNITIRSLPDVEEPIVEGDTVLLGERATLSSNHQQTRWFLNEDDNVPAYTGQHYVTDSLYESTSYYADAVEYTYAKEGILGLELDSVSSGYSNNSINSGLFLEVNSPVRLKSFTLETDTPGLRVITMQCFSEDCESLSKEVMLEMGQTQVEVDWLLQPDNLYVMSTDLGTNIESLGHSGPRLKRTSGDEVDYPYNLGNDILILGSLDGQSRYFYFYDLEVAYDAVSCESDKVEVTVDVRPLSTLDKLNDKLTIFPNPSTGLITIESEIELAKLRIVGMDGVVINEIKSESNMVDLSLPSGIYYLEAVSLGGARIVKKISIIK